MFKRLQHLRVSFLGFFLLILLFTLGVASKGVAQTAEPTFSAFTLFPDTAYDLPPVEKLSLSVSAGESDRPISVIVTYEESFDPALLEIVSGGHIVYYYEQVFLGVSLILDYVNLDTITGLDGVTAVYLDEIRYLHTDTSPTFIGAPALWETVGGQSMAGEGVVVGIIDTGVWPEHPSFSDPDPAGNPYPSPPAGPYACEFGNESWNPNDLPFTCNNKLIGAYSFLQTYQELTGLTPQEFDSARDDNGHGTHVTTIAAGNGLVASSIVGVERGIISGIAPRSHIVAYRACAIAGCYASDSLAAIEQAILDGVHVLNYSISGGVDPYDDPVELAFLSAYANGIFVSTSAGNRGPAVNSVDHRSPWVMTTGASTHTRTYTGTVTLTASGAPTLTLSGASLTGGYTGSVVLAASYGDGFCQYPFAPGSFNGEVVICEQGIVSNVAKSFNVAQGGAGGIIIYASSSITLRPDSYYLPGIQLNSEEGKLLIDFLINHENPIVTLSGGYAAERQGDVMRNSSSRGGDGLVLGINKPDIIAPGDLILAGQTPFPSDSVNRVAGQLFQVTNGTSAAAPHIAGAAALLKQLHPEWAPGQIKSALMTSASTQGIVQADGTTPATPFDYGAGRIDLSAAGNPGITFSTTAEEFLLHQHDLWHVNYPGLFVPTMTGIITVGRTLKSELLTDTHWIVTVDTPSDLFITLPLSIPLRAGNIRPIEIKVDASQVPVGEVRQAMIYFQSGEVVVRFPVTVVRRESPVLMEKQCDPAAFMQRIEFSNCSITLTNTNASPITVTLFDLQPRILQLVEGSVQGANQLNTRAFVYTGTLAAAEPPTIQLVPGNTPANGFLPLAELGIPPRTDMGDETMLSFTLSPFVYNNNIYTRLKMSSNGYVVVGNGSDFDQQLVNQTFPDPVNPNNVIAPFWSDLNPGVGGEIRTALVHGTNDDNWAVFEWNGVPNYADGGANTFQIWVGLNGIEDISIAYGDEVSTGSEGLVTVGAENELGTVGYNWYVNGSGTAVNPNDQLEIVTFPGNPGASHVVTYTVVGYHPGLWTNCAQLASSLWAGFSVHCFGGEVIPLPEIVP